MGDGLLGQGEEAGHAHGLVGLEDVHQVVGHPRPLLGRGLVRPDVQAPVDHGGVGGDHLHGDLLPQAEGQKGLAASRGAREDGDRLHVPYAKGMLERHDRLETLRKLKELQERIAELAYLLTGRSPPPGPPGWTFWKPRSTTSSSWTFPGCAPRTWSFWRRGSG